MKNLNMPFIVKVISEIYNRNTVFIFHRFTVFCILFRSFFAQKFEDFFSTCKLLVISLL